VPEAAGDEQQPVGGVGGHAHGHTAREGVDEPLDGAMVEVAAEDVASEQVAGVEAGPTGGGDALGRARPGQQDHLGCWGRGGRRSQHGQQRNQQQRHSRPPAPRRPRTTLRNLLH
jgi:hypothetical protein